MVKEFSERKRERAAEERRGEQARTAADQRIKEQANEVLDKILGYMMEHGISDVQYNIDQLSNRVTLTRSTGTLEISPKEIGSPELESVEWQYDLDDRPSSGRQHPAS